MTGIQEIVNRQINQWNLERERSARPAVSPHSQPVRPTITLSRQRGSGGRALAVLLAERLGYTVLDREIIDYMARDAGVRREVLESLDGRRRKQLEIWVEGILSGRMVDHGDYFRGLGQVIRAAVLHGSAIILGRGACFLVDDRRVLRVRAAASEEHRVKRLVENEGMAEAQALEEIRRADEERSAFVKKYFHRDIADPTGYDLILNLGTMNLETAADLVVTALEARL